MQDLNSTMLFVKVVVCGSFTAAANALGIPKSTVSDKVAELEEELGVTLLTRTTRKLKLTDVGEEFFRKAESAVGQLQAAGEEAAQAQRAPTGILRITAPSELFIYNNLLGAVSEYRAKFPKVRVELDFTDRMVDLIAEGCDIAVRAGQLADSGLMAKKLGYGSFLVVASEAYLRKAPPLKQPKDLLQHQCIVRIDPPSSDVWNLRTKQGKTARIQVPTSVSSNSFSAITAMAVLGQGVALIPDTICQGELKAKKLTRVLPEWATAETSMSLVYPSQRFSSPKVREMLPLLEKRLREFLSNS